MSVVDHSVHQYRQQARSHFHSLVWLFWLLAGISAISSNPLLNILIIAQTVLVVVTCHTASPVGRAFGLFVRLGLVLVLMRTVFAGVPVGGFSYGNTALFRLPQFELPIWLGGLNIGGQVTLEMIANGLISGVRLWTLILVFGAFNAVADHYGLLRRVPRMLFHAGLATTIALTFVPQVVQQLQAIRDAQRIRGLHFRSWRDGLPLLVPLLSGGLERSIQLAEAMESRGYGSTTQHRSRGSEVLLLLGLSLLAIGLYFGLTGNVRGWLAVVLGGLLAVGTLNILSSGPARTRYSREHWRSRDTLVLLASLMLIVAMAAARSFRIGGLLYTAIPRLTLPPFEPLVGAFVLLLSVPALIQLYTSEGADGRKKLQHSTVADQT
jgi:energy-coupling factor transport system permease protein